ncbi:RpiB/LacA/LacB family sugar-phosphate isomerase [Amedibacillus sp. YH-ame6]
MKIALINESSQSTKNILILQVLREVVEPMGHEVFNYGMNDNDKGYEINYADAGLLAAILLNTNAVDFVITGCGTGEGACMATNIYPHVYCGYVKDSMDAYLFSQINHGNAISMPFAKDFGWCADLNLRYIFKELFGCEHGVGYPVDRGPVQKVFREYFSNIKNAVSEDMEHILKRIDSSVIKKVINSKNFKLFFEKNAVYNNTSIYISEFMKKEKL